MHFSLTPDASYNAIDPAMENHAYQSTSTAQYSGTPPVASSFSQVPMDNEQLESGVSGSGVPAVSQATLASSGVISSHVQLNSETAVPISTPVPIVSFSNAAQPVIEKPQAFPAIQTKSKVAKVAHFKPKGTHVSQLMYLHPQQDIVSRLQQQDVPNENIKVEDGST